MGEPMGDRVRHPSAGPGIPLEDDDLVSCALQLVRCTETGDYRADH